jgi:DNA repair protein RadC
MYNSNNYIFCAVDAAAMFRREIGIAGESEGLFVLPLGANGEVLKKPFLVSIGTQKGIVEVQLGEVFAEAYKVNAKAIIVAHNHPSGDPRPSKADIAFTDALKDMCDRLGNIQFVDHLIIGSIDSVRGQGFVSIAEMS